MNTEHPPSFPLPALHQLFWLRKGRGWAAAGFAAAGGLCGAPEVALQQGQLCLLSLQNIGVVQPAQR